MTDTIEFAWLAIAGACIAANSGSLAAILVSRGNWFYHAF